LVCGLSVGGYAATAQGIYNLHIDDSSYLGGTDAEPDKKVALLLSKISNFTYDEDSTSEVPIDKDIDKIFLQDNGFNLSNIKRFDIPNIFATTSGLVLSKNININGSQKKLTIIAFRGTDGIGDGIADAAAVPTPFSDNTNIKVHSGFHNYFKAFRDADSTFVDIINNRNTIFILTGHSLGGAISKLYAASLAERGIDNDHILTYTFGAPPVSRYNDGFRSHYNYYSDYEPLTIIESGNILDPVFNLAYKKIPNYGFLERTGRSLMPFDESGEIHHHSGCDMTTLTTLGSAGIGAVIGYEKGGKILSGVYAGLGAIGGILSQKYDGKLPTCRFYGHKLDLYVYNIYQNLDMSSILENNILDTNPSEDIDITLNTYQLSQIELLLQQHTYAQAVNGLSFDASKLTKLERKKLLYELRKLQIFTNYASFGALGENFQLLIKDIVDSKQTVLEIAKNNIDSSQSLDLQDYKKLAYGVALNSLSVSADILTLGSAGSVKFAAKFPNISLKVVKFGDKFAELSRLGKLTTKSMPYIKKAIDISKTPQFKIVKALIDANFVIDDNVRGILKKNEAGVGIVKSALGLTGEFAKAQVDSTAKSKAYAFMLGKLIDMANNIIHGSNEIMFADKDLKAAFYELGDAIIELIPFYGPFYSQWNLSKKVSDDVDDKPEVVEAWANYFSTTQSMQEEIKLLGDATFVKRLDIVLSKALSEIKQNYVQMQDEAEIAEANKPKLTFTLPKDAILENHYIQANKDESIAFSPFITAGAVRECITETSNKNVVFKLWYYDATKGKDAPRESIDLGLDRDTQTFSFIMPSTEIAPVALTYDDLVETEVIGEVARYGCGFPEKWESVNVSGESIPPELVTINENFEDNSLHYSISVLTQGSFEDDPNIKAITEFGSSYAFGFGRSTCAYNCFDAYRSSLIITFSEPTYIENISFKNMELYEDWGSDGSIFIDGVLFEVFRAKTNTHNADTEYRTYSGSIKKTVSEIEVRVNDITDKSEMFIDDLTINTSQPQEPINLTNGLVAHYEFEDNADDSSGNGNDGTEHGGVTYVDSVIGRGLKLNGIMSNGGYSNPDRVYVQNSETLKFNTYASFSYWVKIDGDKTQTSANCSGNTVDGIRGIVLGKSGDRNGMYINTSESGTSIGFQPWLGGKGGGVSDIETAYQNYRFETYVIDSENNSIKIYVNGTLKEEKIGDFDFDFSNNRDLYIGVSFNRYISGIGGACLDYWYPLDGILDDLRIYNRALNETEIQELYKLGGGITTPTPTKALIFTGENYADGTSALLPFIKEWYFEEALDPLNLTLTVLENNYQNTLGASDFTIEGSTLKVNLTPDLTNPVNKLVVQFTDGDGNIVKVSNSDTFWSLTKTNHAPRLADGQITQLVSATNEPAFLEIATYDADGDTVTLSIEDNEGGYVGFDPDNPNRLFASFSDGNVAHTIKIGLDDGKEKIVKAFNVMQFNETSIDSFYSDVDKDAGDYIYDGIAFGTLKGVVWGQPDPNDTTKRIFRPTDAASLAEALAIIINAENKAGLITLKTADAYRKAFPEWARPYYTFAVDTAALDKETFDLASIYPTRETIAKLIVKTLGLDDKAKLLDMNVAFTDESKFSDASMLYYAKVAHTFGLFMTGSTAKPQETISRAELVMVIRSIFMIPTASLSLSPATVEYGDTLTASLANIHAEGIDGTNYTLYDASSELQVSYVANGVMVSNPIDSSVLPYSLKTLHAILDNDGVKNIVTTAVNITFTDQDSDGIQDTLDQWISDARYVYDDNNNGIPDILDIIYNLGAYTAAGSIEINGQAVSIVEIIRDGYMPYIAEVSNAPALLWQNSTTGAVKFMPINNMIPENTLSVVDSSNINLLPKGIGDFTGDDKADILFHNQNSGNLRIWEMDGATKVNNIQVLGSIYRVDSY